MPELPEVETMCRGICSIEGYQVHRVKLIPCGLKPISVTPEIGEISQTLDRRTVTGVTRLGKRVLIWFDEKYLLVIEPRMTGLVMLENPPNFTHLRFEVLFQRSRKGLDKQHAKSANHRTKKLLFWDRRGLGTIRLMNEDQYQSDLKLRLGPDALEMTAKLFLERFAKTSRAIKVALLDQGLVAGIGNIYAAEILFLAGVDPRTQCNRLSRKQWERVASATRVILNAAIKYEGSTLSDGTYRNAINGEGSYQQCHRVYDREGNPCSRCAEGIIQRIVQAQRSTFFCRSCQRKRGQHPSLL